jgi:hypothetical protein
VSGAGDREHEPEQQLLLRAEDVQGAKLSGVVALDIELRVL